MFSGENYSKVLKEKNSFRYTEDPHSGCGWKNIQIQYVQYNVHTIEF